MLGNKCKMYMKRERTKCKDKLKNGDICKIHDKQKTRNRREIPQTDKQPLQNTYN